MQHEFQVQPPCETDCPSACGEGGCQRTSILRTLIIAAAALTVLGVLVWQGVTASATRTRWPRASARRRRS